MKIGIINYSTGNILSIQNVLLLNGYETLIVNSGKEIKDSEFLILPGVGAFGRAMKELNNRDFIPYIERHHQLGKPILGICLGMQILFSKGSEFGQEKGLNLFEGTVKKLPNLVNEDVKRRLPLPKVGWYKINWKYSNGYMKSGLDEEDCYYFIHSYYVSPKNHNFVLATSKYGCFEYTSIVGDGQVCGIQFHPEKSGKAGIKLLINILQKYA